MNIYLGNLQLKDVVKTEYLQNIQNFLDNNGFKHIENTSEVANKSGNYHIFDIPRMISVCGEDKMNEFIKYLKENNLVGDAFIGTLGLTYQELK